MVYLINFIITDLFPAFLNRFFEILYAPLEYPNMFWILFPLVVTVFLMEMYFSRYPREEKGYHYALENTVYLLFVAVDLVRYLIVQHTVVATVKVYVIVGIVIYAFFLGILDFLHKIPRKMAYKTSSKAIIGFTAYLGIVTVYSDILVDLSLKSLIINGLSFVLMFFLFRVILAFIHFMQPPSHDEVDELLQNVEEELEKAAKEVEGKED
jgi:hypothetical protein